MASMLIKNLPPAVHRKLKASAEEHRRSMAKEALVLIERGLSAGERPAWPDPIKGKLPLTDELLARSLRRSWT
jgi:plasmid stability protein